MCREEPVLRSIGDGITIAVTQSVYDPSDDSFVAIERIRDLVKHPGSVGYALDIGCGSGILSIALAKRDFVTICVDISPCAVKCGLESAKANGVDGLMDVVQCDSGKCLRSSSVHVVVSNPPYLPAPRDEGGLAWWGGGEKGVEVAQAFLTEGLRVCKSGCIVIFVISSLQYYEALVNELLKQCDNVILSWEKGFFFERLGFVEGRGCR